MPGLLGCTACPTPNSFFSTFKQKLPKFINGLETNPKVLDELLKTADSGAEILRGVADIPGVHASPEFQEGAKIGHNYVLITRGTIGLFKNGAPAAVRFWKGAKGLWGKGKEVRKSELPERYTSKAEQFLDVGVNVFSVISDGSFAAAFLVAHPCKLPELAAKSFLSEPFKMPEPIHTIGGLFDTVMMVRCVAKTGHSISSIIRDGVHYKNGGSYFKAYKVEEGGKEYYKSWERKTSPSSGEEYFRYDSASERVDDPVEKFLIFCEQLTRHILSLLDAGSKFGVYLIKVGNISASPVIKITLNAVSATAGMIKLIIDIW